MADDDKKSLSLAPIVVGLALGAATGGAGAIAAGGAGPALEQAARKAWGWFWASKNEQATLWWANVVGTYGDPKDVRESVEERLNDPDAMGVVVESLRNLVDALDPVVVPALGALVGDYLRAKKPADWFLRGASRMLAEMNAAEFRALQAWFSKLAKRREEGELSLQFASSSSAVSSLADSCRVSVVTRTVGSRSLATHYHDPVPVAPEHVDRLSSLLARYGLARTSDGGQVDIEKTVVVRLARAMGDASSS